jgi:hypothetical protein
MSFIFHPPSEVSSYPYTHQGGPQPNRAGRQRSAAGAVTSDRQTVLALERDASCSLKVATIIVL